MIFIYERFQLNPWLFRIGAPANISQLIRAQRLVVFEEGCLYEIEDTTVVFV